jgi:hypothetical protein
MELKSYSEFEVAIAPSLKRMKLEDRQRVLAEMYSLAILKKNWDGMVTSAGEPPEAPGKTATQLKRKRAHINRAIKHLVEADAICPMHIEPLKVDSTGALVKMELSWDIRSVIKHLQIADHELKEMENDLRTNARKNYATNGQIRVKATGLNSAASDFRFIGAIARLLASASCKDVNNVTSKAFMAAFGERYESSRVRKNLQRLAKSAKINIPS